MSNAEFGWESLLHTDAPAGCSLKAALFTTYDRADERLLAEHLLPIFLKLGHEPADSDTEQKYFLLELDERLKQLHDKLVVVSSTMRDETADLEETESSPYGWLWRSIRHLTVGRNRNAVQHAKLWLLHWGAVKDEHPESLEIVVSSANLTSSAFKNQLQAAWRARIELKPQGSKARLSQWGVLPDFLRELAVSADGEKFIAPFRELLKRADCPKGVTFVASVPGTYSRQDLSRKPWGAVGLGKIAPSGRGTVNVSILSPFIGSWSDDALNRWCKRFKGKPNRLKLVWIDKNHPWARLGRWLLPETTLEILSEAGDCLLHLCYESDKRTDTFHEEQEHLPADVLQRWSHAKVYFFKRGTSHRLLVTSANFSTSAWGCEDRNGKLIIENFELGVCIEQATWPFANLEALEDENKAWMVKDLDLPPRAFAVILWAQAGWDGKKVDVSCRCAPNRKLVAKIKCGDKWTAITKWNVRDGRLYSAQVPWADSKRPPTSVQLTCEHETVNVAIFDERSLRERDDTVPPGVDEDSNEVQRMRDKLLFEKYGGHVDVDDGLPSDQEQPVNTPPVLDPKNGGSVPETYSDEDLGGDGAGHLDSFAVPAFDLARQHFQVVDKWAYQVKQDTDDRERMILKRDGVLLRDAFHRKFQHDTEMYPLKAIGAKLAAEELDLQLKEFPEA